MEHVTGSGLLVTGQHYRSDDPRLLPDPVATPVVADGLGVTSGPLVPEVQSWPGWPAEWSTPNWGEAIGGLAGIVSRVSTVFGAIDLNSSVLSTMPPYRVSASGAVVDPLPWMRNPQPEVYTGWTELMKQLVTSYFGEGEAFLWATSRYADGVGGAPGSVRTFVMLHPSWVTVEMAGQMRRYEMGGIDITDDVLHLRYASWPGDPRGHGPLEALAWNLFGAAALERYQSQLTSRSGIPWGILTAPGNLSNTQADQLRDRFVAARLSSNGAPAVLSGGLSLQPFTLSPREMALLELRQFDEARISTLLGVPPTLLGLPTGEGSLVYQNVTAIYDFHWRTHLRPKASTIMEALSNWALPGGQRVELNRDEYVRPSFSERVAGWSTLFGIQDPETGERAITIEEIRSIERLNSATERPATAVSPQ